jgi:hypothetical protein
MKFLAERQGTRAAIRSKLKRLTRAQFQELSTDVYDELRRLNSLHITPSELTIEYLQQPPRLTKSTAQHLADRADMSPKRNQARMKLSTLGDRIHVLVSDVYFELVRRETVIKAAVRQSYSYSLAYNYSTSYSCYQIRRNLPARNSLQRKTRPTGMKYKQTISENLS